MRGWPVVLLGELLKPAGEPVRVQRDKKYPNFGIYSFGRGLFAKPPIDGLATSASTLWRVRAGTFIYSRLIAFEGSYGLVDEVFDGHYLSNEYPSFEIDRDQLVSNFLEAHFRLPAVWKSIAKGSKGVGSRRIRVQPDQVLMHKIALPSLTEQQAIVARLDTLEDKARQVTEHLDVIEQAAEAMTLSLHYKLARGRVVKLSDIVELHEESVEVHRDGQYPQVGVRGFGGRLFAKAAIAGTATTYKRFNRLDPDAILLSQVKGWEGALAVSHDSLSGMYVSPDIGPSDVVQTWPAPRIYAH